MFPFRVSERWEEEKRPKSYLIPEFMERIRQGTIKYKFQIQLHEIKPGDSHLILHASRKWDERSHPWLDLGDVTLTELLPIDVVERTRISLDHHPPSMVIPPAETIFDYNSIPYLRSQVYPVSRMMSSSSPRSKEAEEQALSKATYCIRVRTGNRKGAGTDATVSLTITGEINNDIKPSSACVIN